MPTLVPTRPRDRAAVGAATRLPPPGPAWFPVVMGTGILASLLTTTGIAADSAPVAARLLLALGWAVAVGLVAGWTTHCRRHPGAARASLLDPTQLPSWGTVSMGVLSVGAATLAVLPGVSAGLLPVAVAVDLMTWLVGTALGLATTVRFAGLLLRPASRRVLGRPTPTWGLPVVPPMVSATVGAVLVPHLPAGPGALLLLVSAGCFVVALILGVAVFTLSYLHHVWVEPLPMTLAVSTWIPLGIVGQSVAAAQAGAAAVPDLRAAAAAYGVLMLVVAIPVVAHALRSTRRGLRAGMEFAPGWWALTFPLGTLALGAHLLGEATGWAPVSALGDACVLALVGTWTFCTAVTGRALARAGVGTVRQVGRGQGPAAGSPRGVGPRGRAGGRTGISPAS